MKKLIMILAICMLILTACKGNTTVGTNDPLTTTTPEAEATDPVQTSKPADSNTHKEESTPIETETNMETPTKPPDTPAQTPSDSNPTSKPDNTDPPVIAVSGISLNKSSATVEIGDTVTLIATVNPNNAANKAVIWNSSNSNVASVDNSGKVTAKSAGIATVTVKTSNGKTASCTVTVNAPPQPKSIYDRPYNISEIEKDMETYIKNKGGNYNWNLNMDNCGYWVDPLPTSSKWTGDKLRSSLRADIDDRISMGRYSNFRVYFHPIGGEYEIIVLCG